MRTDTTAPIEEWPSKQEVIERLGIGLRTLERKIQLGEIRKDFRPTLGSKPIVVIHPADVAKLERLTLKPTPGERQDAARMPPENLAKEKRRHGAASHKELSRDELMRKMYLTLAEAAWLSGLSRTYLEHKRDAGILPCFQDGRTWKIRLLDLGRYDAATGTWAAWHGGGMMPAVAHHATRPLAIPDARH